MKLNELMPSVGSTTSRKRVGRGMASGKGKTCGAGQKGQKARTGIAIKGFEGGQMPIFQRLPKRGFVNLNRKEVKGLNIGAIQTLIDTKVFNENETITKDLMVAKGLIKSNRVLVKLLAKGEIKSAVKIDVDAVSAAAKAQIEKAKGTVNIII